VSSLIRYFHNVSNSNLPLECRLHCRSLPFTLGFVGYSEAVTVIQLSTQLAIQYRIDVAGSYQAQVKYSSAAVATFPVVVSAASLNLTRSSVVISSDSFSTIIAGASYTVFLQLRDSYNNKVTCQDAQISTAIALDYPSGAATTNFAIQTTESNCSINFSLTRSGSYNFYVYTQMNGLISGSSIPITVVAGAVTLSNAQICLTQEFCQDTLASESAVFQQDTMLYALLRDSHGNTIVSPPSVRMIGTNVIGSSLVVDTTSNTNPIQFTVSTSALSVGTTLRVNFVLRLSDCVSSCDVVPMWSPLTLTVIPSSKLAIAANSFATGSGLTQATAGVQNSFTIEARSITGETANQFEEAFMVQLVHLATNQIYFATITQNNSLVYMFNAAHTLTKAGSYQVNVKLGNAAIGSLVNATLVVSPAVISFTQSVVNVTFAPSQGCSGSFTNCIQAGTPINVTIQPFDAFSNAITRSTDIDCSAHSYQESTVTKTSASWSPTRLAYQTTITPTTATAILTLSVLLNQTAVKSSEFQVLAGSYLFSLRLQACLFACCCLFAGLVWFGLVWFA
jgi:hypothetical protein